MGRAIRPSSSGLSRPKASRIPLPSPVRDMGAMSQDAFRVKEQATKKSAAGGICPLTEPGPCGAICGAGGDAGY